MTVQIFRFEMNAKVQVGCHQSFLVPSDPTREKRLVDVGEPGVPAPYTSAQHCAHLLMWPWSEKYL